MVWPELDAIWPRIYRWLDTPYQTAQQSLSWMLNGNIPEVQGVWWTAIKLRINRKLLLSSDSFSQVTKTVLELEIRYNQLVRNTRPEQLNTPSWSQTPRFSQTGNERKNRQENESKMYTWNDDYFVIPHQQTRSRNATRRKHQEDLTTILRRAKIYFFFCDSVWFWFQLTISTFLLVKTPTTLFSFWDLALLRGHWAPTN